MRKFSVASSALMKGYKSVRESVEANNPLDAVYEAHPKLLAEVIQGVKFLGQHSTTKISYFEVETPSGIHKVIVEDDN